MRTTHFTPKLDDPAGHHSRPALNLWPLGISAVLLFGLSYLLRRFVQTPQTLLAAVVLVGFAALLFFLIRQNNVFTGLAKPGIQPSNTDTASHSVTGAASDSASPAARQLSTTLPSGLNKADEAWAEAVVAYECAMWRLAEGKPGSRTEAQTSALELARLQGLLMQASQPHLPLGLEATAFGATADIP